MAMNRMNIMNCEDSNILIATYSNHISIIIHHYPSISDTFVEEQIVVTGDAVQTVFYVAKGTCVTERPGGVANIEYHQDWQRPGSPKS